MKKAFRWLVNFIVTLDWRETWRYFIIGVGSTLIDIFVFWLLSERLGVNTLIANPVAWFFSTAFSFVFNCLYVFRVRPESAGEMLGFGVKFYGERIFTLTVDELIILIFHTLLKLPAMPVKLAGVLVVIALNYIISKFMIFRTGETPAAEGEGSEHDG